MKFLVKYPSRSRPDLFRRRASEWQAAQSPDCSVEWIASFDEDDETMNNPSMLAFCRGLGIAPYYGHSKTKIEAINADIDKATTDWDVLVLMADDMACTQSRWDKVIESDLAGNLNQGIWYPDGRQGRLCTVMVFGRPIYNEFGHIYDPAYKSVYADDWYQFVMQRTNRLKRVDHTIFRHEWKVDNDDALMIRNEHPRWYGADRLMFRDMKARAECVPV